MAGSQGARTLQVGEIMLLEDDLVFLSVSQLVESYRCPRYPSACLYSLSLARGT